MAVKKITLISRESFDPQAYEIIAHRFKKIQYSDGFAFLMGIFLIINHLFQELK